MNILDWLADSMKNLHWFKIMHNVKENKMFFDEYEVAFEGLKSIKNREYLTKTEYLAWVATWKGTYAKLSDESRFAKNNRKATRVGWETSKENVLRVYRLRRLAVKLLDLRDISRVKAEESFQKDRVKEVVPA